ncbi:MAG: VTT domain-containing protein [Tissierellia bacterium]|nr:VTT domain-containing protein [Tissierellia bacterium]MDD4781230.1 VTT domain-containing protein [Tissierellia bacterium]
MEYTVFILEYVKQGGPLFGILLPIIEAFIPILPLVGFVIINVSVFGLFFGYIYSWIGNCIGSLLLFLLIKKVGGNFVENKIKNSKYNATLEKIRQKNFSLVFFLFCFPFTPSFLISGASALANMDTIRFFLILLPSKLIMMISLSFIGVNVKSFFENPYKSIFFVLLILFFNIICKKVVNIIEKNNKRF